MNALTLAICIDVAIIVAAIVTVSLVRDQAKDRLLSIFSLIAVLVTLTFSVFQNASSAKDAERSATASEESARAAQTTLAQANKPVLTIRCDSGRVGQGDFYVPLQPGNAPLNTLPATVVYSRTSYITCTLKNLGHEPIQDAVLSVEYEFRDVSFRSSRQTQHLPYVKSLPIHGLGLGSPMIIWFINNSSELGLNFTTPMTINYNDVSNARQTYTLDGDRNVVSAGPSAPLKDRSVKEINPGVSPITI